MVGRFISWLTAPVEGPMPTLDRIAIFLAKASYLSLRISLKVILGRKRRDSIRFLKRFWFDGYNSLSFHLLKFFYISIMKIRDNNTGRQALLKIKVPKHGYQYYCRIDKGDFIPDHEDHILQQFIPREGDTVVDVGAHIGRYSILGSKMVGPKGRVIAIEADSQTFEILSKNIRLNKLTNILPLNYAAYSKETKIKLYTESASAKYNSVISTRATNSLRYTEVNANTLDNILQSIGIMDDEVNWIKIDVEGAEYEVLKGAQNILSKGKDISILVEVHNIQDQNHYKRITDLLFSFDFQLQFERNYEYSGEKHVIFRRSVIKNN